jgi:hypothetical protein|tara:strand:- start:1003 stop:1164 length:162 start_codon:yes stop_codon:yes gene_type:complete
MEYKIVASKILVEWDDNPKMEVVLHDMPSDLEQAFGAWLTEIEHERNQGEGER